MFRSAFFRCALVLAVLVLGLPATASASTTKLGRSGQAYHWVAGSC